MASDISDFAPPTISSRGRPLQGASAGALSGAGASVFTGLIENLVFSEGTASTLVSPLIPIFVLLFSAFVLLPIVWLLLNKLPSKVAITMPPIVISTCCAICIAIFPNGQSRLALLAIDTFVVVLIPLLAASVVAHWVWVSPKSTGKDVVPL